jgi:flagellar basal-body rod modification protein FlgD
MITPIGNTTQSADPSGTNNPVANLATKDMFLKLMVAQLRNQSPLNPQDGVQFLTQLASFTNLEQTMDIRTAVDQIRDKIAPVTPPADPVQGTNP